MCSFMYLWQYASIGLGKGLALNRWQVITWNSLAHFTVIFALPGYNMLTNWSKDKMVAILPMMLKTNFLNKIPWIFI